MNAPLTRSLDARFYTDPAVFEVERKGLLAQTWQFAGHSSQLENPGDYFAFEMAGESLFCIKGRDGVIRTFYNVCQHRAHQLVSGAGSTRVVAACADRSETWINNRILMLYDELHRSGYGHSVEVFAPDGALAGGLDGVALGAAFFGESMFSRRTDASKIALAYLVDRLRRAGFQLFDTQFVTLHLTRLGAQEVSRGEYHRRLVAALGAEADFAAPGPLPGPQELLQRSTQMS